VRAKSISDLGLTYSNPSAVARLVANRVAYASAPYGHPLAGTAHTLASLTRDKVAYFYERCYRPDNAILIIGGDIAPDDAFALAQRVLGDWQKPSTPLAPPLPFLTPAARARVVVIDKPDAGRTAIVSGRVAIARSSPDYFAGTVTTALLAGYSGRLNQEIRVKRGLSYGAGAQLATRREPGLFIASTLVDHTKVAQATQVVLETVAGLAQAPVDAKELTTRKSTVTGAFYRSIETIDGIAANLGELALYEMPLRDLENYVPGVAGVDAADVRRFANVYLAGDAFVVLVGDAAIFGDEIRAAYPDVQIIPAGQLDLDRTNLMA
jgi:zinc protease